MGNLKNDAPVQIRRMIEKAHFSSLDRLPPERALAEQLGLTRHRLRKELAALQEEGLISRHVGQGTFLGPQPPPPRLQLGTLVDTTSPAEILEMKLVIEPKIASMAAMRATRQEMDRMDRALRRGRAATRISDREKWDLILHEIIARSAANHLLFTVFGLIYQLRKGENWGLMTKAYLSPARWRVYAAQHEQLVTAIRDRNASLAEERMREHIETVRDHLVKRP